MTQTFDLESSGFEQTIISPRSSPPSEMPECPRSSRGGSGLAGARLRGSTPSRCVPRPAAAPCWARCRHASRAAAQASRDRRSRGTGFGHVRLDAVRRLLRDPVHDTEGVRVVVVRAEDDVEQCHQARDDQCGDQSREPPVDRERALGERIDEPQDQSVDDQDEEKRRCDRVRQLIPAMIGGSSAVRSRSAQPPAAPPRTSRHRTAAGSRPRQRPKRAPTSQPSTSRAGRSSGVTSARRGLCPYSLAATSDMARL